MRAANSVMVFLSVMGTCMPVRADYRGCVMLGRGRRPMAEVPE